MKIKEPMALTYVIMILSDSQKVLVVAHYLLKSCQ